MSTRPNILLIFTDQQRADTIHALGNPVIQTPALDSLVREGTSFTAAYTPSPVCIAARCSLLLSQWPHQTGCTANSAMPQERPSLMQWLQEAGYQTHGVGKMHFAPDSRKLWGFESRDYSEENTLQDDFAAYVRAQGYAHIMNMHGLRSEYYYIPQPSQLPARLHHTTWVAERALAFLQNRDKRRPFFLWASFIKPHPPFEAPVPWNRLYKPVHMPAPFMPQGYEQLLTYWNRLQNRYKWRDRGFDGHLLQTMRAAYYACISFLDYNVGRMLDYLRECQLLDQTLIIFTSDHGELLGDYGSFGKRCMLDPAARIPLIVRYPERFTAGTICPALASLVDILPTCLKAAGLKTPADAIGIDLAEIATGKASRDTLLCQYGEGAAGLYCLITPEWKYVYSAADEREWLLSRQESPEEHDWAAARPEIVATLRERLMAHFLHDGYDKPLDEGHWRRFPKPDFPANPDEGLLYQESAAVEDLFPEGYRPPDYPRWHPPQGL